MMSSDTGICTTVTEQLWLTSTNLTGVLCLTHCIVVNYIYDRRTRHSSMRSTLSSAAHMRERLRTTSCPLSRCVLSSPVTVILHGGLTINPCIHERLCVKAVGPLTGLDTWRCLITERAGRAVRQPGAQVQVRHVHHQAGATHDQALLGLRGHRGRQDQRAAQGRCTRRDERPGVQ